MTNGDPFEDNGSAADPDAIANLDRSMFQRRGANRVLISIHDQDITRDLAVSPELHGYRRDDFRITVEVRAIADGNHGVFPAFDSYARKETTITDRYRAA